MKEWKVRPITAETPRHADVRLRARLPPLFPLPSRPKQKKINPHHPPPREIPGQAERTPPPQKTGASALKPGDLSPVVPPGPVPNPAVKRWRADGSESIALVRVGRRRD